MNWALLLMQLIPTVTKGIQTLAGDKVSGADKKQTALDMLDIATGGALSVTTGNNQVFAAAASTVASSLIDAFVKANNKTPAWTEATATGNAVVAATTATTTASPTAAVPTVTVATGK